MTRPKLTTDVLDETVERAISEHRAAEPDNPQELAEQTLQKVREMCRGHYQGGYSVGYAKGFEAGVKAAMPPTVEVPNQLV